MATIVLTGASRGIGLALTEQFASRGDRVIATCRAPDVSPLLQAMQQRFPDSISIEQLDVTDDVSVAALATRLADVRIDTLINNAGVLGGHQQSFAEVDFAIWRETLETNLLSPFRVSRALIGNLGKSDTPKLVVISSELGSSVWPLGGLYIYASSKGGLNRVIQMMSIDLRPDNICVVAMHPGLVKTDMAGDVGIISPEESASGIHKVVSGLTMADSGKFMQWNGTPHAW